MSAEKILDRLLRVKQTRPDSYLAACPCCQSKRGRPVSVRKVDDRVLLHAFCGCETEAVLGAIGLTLSDLFDGPLKHHLPPVRAGFTARELLEASSHEIFVAVLIVSDAEGRELELDERRRLAQAAARLQTVKGFL